MPVKSTVLLFAVCLLVGCTTTTPYGPAKKAGAMGYTTQQIEAERYQVSYTDSDPQRARDLALLRAAELTLLEGGDWFEITNSYTDAMIDDRGSRSSISIGGSSGSSGRSSVGMGVGIGFPIGGSNSSGSATEVLEIMIGSGEKPDRPTVYDARSVDINLRSAVR